MRELTRTEARQLLDEYAAVVSSRNARFKAAFRAGLTKKEIADRVGMSNVYLYQIWGEVEAAEDIERPGGEDQIYAEPSPDAEPGHQA
jgi:hypothetical protein